MHDCDWTRPCAEAFREDPNVSVILMSLKSGGEGLNPQAANYVFVLEPWWNPAVGWCTLHPFDPVGFTNDKRPVFR